MLRVRTEPGGDVGASRFPAALFGGLSAEEGVDQGIAAPHAHGIVDAANGGFHGTLGHLNAGGDLAVTETVHQMVNDLPLALLKFGTSGTSYSVAARKKRSSMVVTPLTANCISSRTVLGSMLGRPVGPAVPARCCTLRRSERR